VRFMCWRHTSFDDANVAFGSAGQLSQRFLIGRAVIRRCSLFHRIEPDQYRALLESCLIHETRDPRAGMRPPEAMIAGPASLA
jgi:hypothetical protein